MRQYIVTRVLDTAAYMLKTGATVRGCANQLGVSKTTVHKDMRTRLPIIDPELYKAIDRVLGINMSERHLRGGEATRKKYEEQAEA